MVDYDIVDIFTQIGEWLCINHKYIKMY
jgi:hypothetical protein